MAIILDKMIWDKPKLWKSFAINEDRIMGIIPKKFNLDYTVTNEIERKVFLTFTEVQNMTEGMFNDGNHQIVDFGNKKGALQIEIKRLVMQVDNMMGSLFKQTLLEGLLEDNIVSSIAHEGMIRFIVENDWVNHYYEILAMIVVTKGIPMISVISFVLKPSKPTIILSIISNLAGLSYELFQIYVRKNDYFKDFYNYLDISSYMFGLIWHFTALSHL